ncbi:endonuclease/exonuclease/phosphatase family protein [Erythrobacter rubeus]|uniref:Endonuclease/exonuclease/phosphatase family protein n=1 Tax=Erythrobacter rubeus TaxID=2760803 RepID=A0ABR8KND6_9SPHN|nr:endonuclease/exonuclease/phosphatase family protein [Erythrobacter rubeus]MBD2840643.1 endonuclease/exonuclease/phosphatase family protein [Erythrobacter rubeus]
MSRSPKAGPATTFKLVSYNIHKCVGTDRRRDPMRVLRVLLEVDADIVVLQEADHRFGSRRSAIPQFLIENHSDYRPIPFDVQHESIGWHGNTILVRRSVEIESHSIVSIPYLEPRGVVTADLNVSGRSIAVFGMHLDLSGLWRTRQARAIAELAQQTSADRPTLLSGDLNEWRRSSGAFREFERHFEILDCGRSFHSRRPVAQLDRIIHNDQVTALACGVHRSALAAKASDHLPVWGKFRLN